MPVGANILWPENARKSQSRSRISTFMCGTDCAASTIRSAPMLCAFFASSLIGLIVPRTLEQCVIEIIFVFFVISFSAAFISNLKSFVSGILFILQFVAKEQNYYGVPSLKEEFHHLSLVFFPDYKLKC